MENIREHIYFAALLHDIGKFYRRADTGSISSSKYLTRAVKDLEDKMLPLNNGVRTHKHCLWTAQFIEDNKQVFDIISGNDSTGLSNSDNLMQLAAGHHLPFSELSDLGGIIKEAHSLSFSMDRDSEIALKGEQDGQEENWDAYKQKRMTSVLEGINLSDEDFVRKTKWRHLPVEKLSLNRSLFAKDNFENAPDYKNIWKEFLQEFKLIRANSYKAFSETLLNLLFKYSGCVPASTVHFTDISLYDHSKMTAALAVCLYDWSKENEKPESPFLLISGDLSGIQSYIYQIVSKYAAKNLKGRSFYLRLVSDAVTKYLLNELNLFQANIVYNSGGSFYMIAPNTLFVREKLDDAIKKIEQNMYKAHGTALYVALESVEVSKKDLMNSNEGGLPGVWSQLFSKRDKKKNKKFDYLIEQNYSEFFEPKHFGIKTDKISGEGISMNEEAHQLQDVGTVKQLTYQQVELGKRLRESDLLVISQREIPSWKSKNPIEPIGLGLFYYLLKESDLKLLKEESKELSDHLHIITFNGKDGNCDFMHPYRNRWMESGANNILGLEFYGGNIFDGNSFDKFCHSDNEDAYKRLGVLRMDVDNLGNIFQKGIPSKRATLSRYAALSRSFDYFFSGYLNSIQQKIAPHSSFIIYSGGDDLFIVASWEDAIELAKQIRNDFRDFTCNNPAFSLSGGIAIVAPKYPIMKGAQESEHEERLSKEHVNVDNQKNALSFMNMPLNWDDEFSGVERVKDLIVKLTSKNEENREHLPKSFIGKLLNSFENAAIEDHKINNLKTYWITAYDFGRMLERTKNTEARNLIENCKKEICTNQNALNGENITTTYHAIELWTLAARWAELEIRTNK